MKTKLRLLTLLQCFCLMLLSAMGMAKNLHAQQILNKSISLKLDHVNFRQALMAIEKQVDAHFVYSSNMIEADKQVSLTVNDELLSAVLLKLLSPNQITFEVVENQIILKKGKVQISAEPTTLNLVDNTIKGRVSTESGEALPGVNIQIKGTSKGVTTNNSGDYEISVPSPEVTLIFSFVGYIKQEIKVGTSTSINIVLKSDDKILQDVVVVGSRFSKPRTDIDRPVAIDVINAKEIQSSGQVDLGQAIHYLAPSFSAVKFGINETAPFVDPASLRGLGPDQVLMLVNNKRRHKVSFLSINDGVGKGQVGTDINVVPSLSLKRVEVLRDGAAAQYGSDAIAGVINLELNDASSGGTVSVYTGVGNSKPQLDVTGVATPKTIVDGKTYNLAANFGLGLGKKGFLNTTISYSHTDGYDRSGTYKAAAGFYVRDAVQDAALVAQNGINLDRALLGAAENTTYGIFMNAGTQINDKFKFYAFGGYTNKYVLTGVFTRPPSNARRNALTIFPNGYNPLAPATLQDFSLTAGVKGKLNNGWSTDFSISQGSNKVDWSAKNTVNPSLGAASPTEFYVGQTKVTQTLVNADISKTFGQGGYPNFSLAAGTEFRYETFAQKAGDEAAWIAGPLFKTKDVGSSGREGFSPKTAGSWGRTNVGVYVEGESDISKQFLIGTALRVENYSDFGSNFSYKFNTRYKIGDPFSVRASASRGFRAPGMVQSHYSNYINISFDNAGNSIINPIIPATGELAKLLGIDGLKSETSFDLSGGITSKIGEHLTFTADVYQVDVDNRIMASSGINVSKIPAFVAAGFPQTAVVFVNAIDTRTQGFEFVAGYDTQIGENTKLALNLAYSSMNTTLRANRKTDTGVEVADAVGITYITDGLPKNKLIASANLNTRRFGLMLRSTRFGSVADPLATLAVKPTDPTAIGYQIFAAKTLTDVAVTYKATPRISATLGVNNLFDVYPDLLQVPQTTNEVIFSRRTNQFGTQGRFINFAVNYSF